MWARTEGSNEPKRGGVGFFPSTMKCGFAMPGRMLVQHLEASSNDPNLNLSQCKPWAHGMAKTQGGCSKL